MGAGALAVVRARIPIGAISQVSYERSRVAHFSALSRLECEKKTRRSRPREHRIASHRIASRRATPRRTETRDAREESGAMHPWLRAAHLVAARRPMSQPVTSGRWERYATRPGPRNRPCDSVSRWRCVLGRPCDVARLEFRHRA